MKFENFVGWILLFFGIFVILWSLYNCYQIFGKKITLPQLIKNEKISQQNSKKVTQEVEKVIEEKLNEIFPSEEIRKFLNLLAVCAIYGIFIFGGGQIGSLGVKLLKK